MASTFSPNLRIELIGAGEQAGTWGTTTNTNLGTLIEDAISGVASVAILSANQALTAANGAADEARNAIIELASAPSAFAVYAPPESKQYTIVNNTSYAATIYNSTALGNTTAAGTGVAIPSGKTMTVWSDGTDFALQNTRFAGDFVGELTGTIASATTGVTQATSDSSTKIATTAFVQAIKASLHPVGSIYINAVDNTNPATLLGFGTWTAFGAGRVPVGFNAADPLFDTAEETGGSKDAVVVSHTHTGTTASNGSHNHGYTGNNGNGYPDGAADNIGEGSSLSYVRGTQVLNAGTHTHTFTTDSTGVSGTNANLQPYITVYMWKRTA